MAELKRVRMEWGGSGIVGPGVSTFYMLSSETTAVAALNAFTDAIKAYIPNDVYMEPQNTGDVIESTTGALVSGWSEATTPIQRYGTNVGTYPRGVGARIVWNTAAVVNGHRVSGATFLVPIAGSNFDDAGLLSSAAAAAFETPANDFLGDLSAGLVVWTRPDANGNSGYSSVTSASVPRNPAWLRTRKT